MSIYDYSPLGLDGNEVSLREYAGKVMLIVNVASRCGFTPQYTGLQGLWDKYRDKGLVVLGFPCDQFGHQEPGTDHEIRQFCSAKYGITFPMFSKIEVNGANTHPLFAELKSSAPGVLGSEAIKWNFTKFLVDRAGEVLKRYGSIDAPEKLVPDIERALRA